MIKNFILIFFLIYTVVFVIPSFAINKELLKAAKEQNEAEKEGLEKGVRFPVGPGDRDFRAKIKIEGDESDRNIDVWVLYSNNREFVENSKVEDEIPKGKAEILETFANNEMIIRFIFPHSDHPQPNSTDKNPKIFNGGETVYYKLVKEKGASHSTSGGVVEFIMPEELTIAIMGDSFAAGEGAPSTTQPLWDHEPAHRSKNSSKARAVRDYINSHPETAVAVINVSSSGAGINRGIIGSQLRKRWFDPDLHSNPVRPQIFQVRDWMRDNDFNKLNIILMSIGVNEIFFDEVVTNYFIGLGALDKDLQARRNIELQINELGIGYNAIKDNFERSFFYDKVLVTEYPDLTHGKNGRTCGDSRDTPNYGSCWNFIEVTSGSAEYEIAYAALLRMNEVIENTINKFSNWTFIDGPRRVSERHGLCNCDEPWFNTIGTSILIQSDENGTWHPNREGHAAFVEFELDAIKISVSQLRTENLMKLAESNLQDARERAKERAKEKSRAKSKLLRDEPLKPANMQEIIKDKIMIDSELLRKIRDEARAKSVQ